LNVPFDDYTGGAVRRPTIRWQTIAPIAVVLAALAAAGCGGSSPTGAGTTTARSSASRAGTDATQTRTHDCLKAGVRQRELARLARDTAVIKRLADRVERPQDPGPLPLQRATDRFLTHLGTSHLDYMVQNRLTDHAAAAVAFACHMCFEMLENDRPIPAMKYGHSGQCPV
jgi:hypothetical protein